MQRFHKKQFLSLAAVLAALVLFLLLLNQVYYKDNKYTAGPPYGENGVFAFTEADLNRPLYLIDGWNLNGNEVFIGQYSNFSYLPDGKSPFGTGTYSLTLRYDGEPCTLLLEIPDIFTEYVLFINGRMAAGGGTAQVSVPVGNGDTNLKFITENQGHYYSGLTYPPALGTDQVIGRLFFIRTLLYAAVCFSTLTLALFSAVLWLSRYRDKLFLHFGLLCLAFSVHCAHPLIWQSGLSGRLWYALEDISWLFVLAQAIHLAAVSAGLGQAKWYRRLIRPAALAACLFAAVSILIIIPADGSFIGFYGGFVDGYKVVSWLFLALCAGIGLFWNGTGTGSFLLGAAGILGVSLLIDVFDSNQYEPIYGLWQNEYAGLLMVLLFAGLMVRRILFLLRESRELQALSIQYRFAEESAARMRSSAEQIHAMKHELNHHIEALAALCEEGCLPRIKEYIAELRTEKDALPVLAYSNHFLVNAMLTGYLEPARRKGIQINCRVLIPEELPLPDAELCTLLSNILQNAAEACASLPEGSTPFIRFEMTLKGNLLSFLCANAAPPGSGEGLLPTTKKDKENHGFGLSAISRITEKYNGTVNMSKEGGVFTLRGVLSMPVRR
ncbi:sensor histidine kinase [Anaerolentibacter hominis]|uniref:sensor histidine kinase n=1 Tax=Anaerolentibacter hominis TaxID=3079009 RepID=UPI0031B80E0F